MFTAVLIVGLVFPGLVMCGGLGAAPDPVNSAVVLQYHQFGNDTPAATSIPVDLFEQHLKYLAENNFAVWPLESIISHLQEGGELPERCVAITVDDAYSSILTEAYPRLQARGWPLTVFVATEGIDAEYGSYLTWDQMRSMSATGVTFAPHSHTHGHLVQRLPAETEEDWAVRVEHDILTSCRRLAEELGSRSPLFAYPYGEYDSRLREIVLHHGLVGFGQQSGALWSGSDFGALPRFPMASDFAVMSEFKVKVNSLPLPVLRAEPLDPVLPDSITRPVLRLWLGQGDYRPDQLAGYASGLGRITLQWISRAEGLIQVQADSSLPWGRSRYNITAPHVHGGRYYWYSHPWIQGETRD